MDNKKSPVFNNWKHELPYVLTILIVSNVLTVLWHLLDMNERYFNATAEIVIKYVGLAFIVYGLIIILVEKKSGLPFFYGRSQRGGSNANGAFIIGLGSAMFSHNLLRGMIVSLVLSVLVLLERYFAGQQIHKKSE